jgi:putative transposase
MGVVSAITFLHGALGDRTAVAAENLALRRQLAILQASAKRPQLRCRDRVFWVRLSQLWSGWRSCLMIVKPNTVIAWPRQGFRLYLYWQSRRKLGRPKTEAEIRKLIRRIARENPT